MILERSFYLRQVQTVAFDLLGQILVRRINGQSVAGIIVETEAYDGEKDQACHARSGKTERNQVMYGHGGHAYVYFTYGMHWMLNCVTGAAGYPAAVLIRSLFPIEGLDMIRKIREPIPQNHWCNGPAKLTKALSITGKLNGADLCSSDAGLWIEKGMHIPTEGIKRAPRIGIQYAPEPWKSKNWRYTVHMKEDLLKKDIIRSGRRSHGE